MKTLSITKEDYRKYYLYQYYKDQKFIVKIMRIIGGPILILMGLNYYTVHEYHVAVSLFFIGYGIFYIARPFLEIAIRKPKEAEFSYRIEKSDIIIEDGGKITRLNLYDYPLHSNKKSFYIYGENKHVIFFPKDKLDPETIETFQKQVH